MARCGISLTGPAGGRPDLGVAAGRVFSYNRGMRFAMLTALALTLTLTTTGESQSSATRMAALSMEQKLMAIAARGGLPEGAAPLPRQRTSFTEREVNAYFEVFGPEFLPEGVVDPRVTIQEGGRIGARAIVDLDRALRPQERGWLDPLAWLRGQVEVVSTGVLSNAGEGRGVLNIETATLNGVTIPISLLQTIVGFYTSTPEQPNGFQLGQPFELPSGIRSVESTSGRATVVQ
jgi:hypothetical protein